MGLRDRSAAHFRQYRGQNLTVADKTIKRIIGYPIVSHIDAQVNADGFYEARPACQRLGHHDTQNVQDDTVGEFQQPLEQAGNPMHRVMAQGDVWLIGVEPKHLQHRAPPLVKTGFGHAGFDAFGHSLVARFLVLHLHTP